MKRLILLCVLALFSVSLIASSDNRAINRYHEGKWFDVFVIDENEYVLVPVRHNMPALHVTDGKEKEVTSTLNGETQSTLQTSDGRYYVLTGDRQKAELWVWESNSFKRIKFLDGYFDDANDRRPSMHEGENGRIIVASTSGKMYVVSPDTKEAELVEYGPHYQDWVGKLVFVNTVNKKNQITYPRMESLILADGSHILYTPKPNSFFQLSWQGGAFLVVIPNQFPYESLKANADSFGPKMDGISVFNWEDNSLTKIPWARLSGVEHIGLIKNRHTGELRKPDASLVIGGMGLDKDDNLWIGTRHHPNLHKILYTDKGYLYKNPQKYELDIPRNEGITDIHTQTNGRTLVLHGVDHDNPIGGIESHGFQKISVLEEYEGEPKTAAHMSLRNIHNGVDMGQRLQSHPNGRPIVNVDSGTFIGTRQNGLIYVPNDSDEVKHIDWKTGLKLSTIDQIKIKGHTIFLTDNEAGVSVGIWAGLIHSEENQEDWERYTSICEPLFDVSGAWYISTGLPHILKKLHAGGELQDVVELEPDLARRVGRIMTDTSGNIWLMPSDRNGRIALVENPVRGTAELLDFNNIEQALEHILKDEEDLQYFLMDTARTYYNVTRLSADELAYTKDRAARLYSKSTETWKTLPPFYTKASITQLFEWQDPDSGREYLAGTDRKTVYIWEDQKWIEKPEVDIPEKVQPNVHLDSSFPYSGNTEAKMYDNKSFTWVMTDNKILYKGFDKTWKRIGQIPALNVSKVKKAFTDSSGDTLFLMESYRPRVFARYRAGMTIPALEVSLEDEYTFNNSLTPIPFKVYHAKSPYQLQWRIGDDEWRKLQINDASHKQFELNPLAEGSYNLEIRLVDDNLSVSNVETRDIHMHFNKNSVLEEAIDLINSDSYEDRDKGSKMLSKLSIESLPELETARSKIHEDSLWWYDAAINAIKRRYSK